MDCSLLGTTVHGILRTRILEWVAISFSREYEMLLSNKNTKISLKIIKFHVVAFTTTWVDLEGIMVYEMSEKDK